MDIEKLIDFLKLSIDVKARPQITIENAGLCLLALREYSERHNPKELTLEELRERVGKPVWRTVSFPKKPSMVRIVEINNENIFYEQFGTADKCWTPIETFRQGRTQFYDNPPEDKQ